MYEKQFKIYREWCKIHNLKPGYATSLEAYKKARKNLKHK